MSRPSSEAIEAARYLLADGEAHASITSVYQITLRDIDRNEENPRVVTFIPIGSVIGIAVHRHDVQPKDEDIVFVAASALSSALPALGYTARPVAAYIVPPKDVA